jgi:hypothetical protein
MFSFLRLSPPNTRRRHDQKLNTFGNHSLEQFRLTSTYQHVINIAIQTSHFWRTSVAKCSTRADCKPVRATRKVGKELPPIAGQQPRRAQFSPHLCGSPKSRNIFPASKPSLVDNKFGLLRPRWAPKSISEARKKLVTVHALPSAQAT